MSDSEPRRTVYCPGCGGTGHIQRAGFDNYPRCGRCNGWGRIWVAVRPVAAPDSEDER